jgi:RHS repeat-associated protein
VRNVPAASVVGKENPSHSYNDADQIAGFNYDALGRLTNDGARTYVWDLASRLTSYSDSQTTASFTYDAFGNRLSRAVRTAGSEAATLRSYIWNYALGLASISIVKDEGNTIRYYIHTPGGSLLYSIEEASNARHFYHYDEIGSTLFLTDDSGTVTDSYAYSPYGQMTASSGSSDNPFTYVGKYGVMREASTDLCYMRARYYDSAAGRFLSRDPVAANPSNPRSLNPYQYAAENPLRYSDSTGADYEKLAYYETLAAYEKLAAIFLGPDPFKDEYRYEHPFISHIRDDYRPDPFSNLGPEVFEITLPRTEVFPRERAVELEVIFSSAETAYSNRASVVPDTFGGGLPEVPNFVGAILPLSPEGTDNPFFRSDAQEPAVSYYRASVQVRKEREQFGQPSSNFRAQSFRLIALDVDLAVLDLLDRRPIPLLPVKDRPNANPGAGIRRPWLESAKLVRER